MNIPSESVPMAGLVSGEEVESAAKPAAPYPGLRAFRAKEAEYFCGRSQHRITLLTLLERSRFLAVLGASGSGKSSLVIAGLLPDIARGRLRSVEPARCRVVSFRPGLNPFRALARALGGALGAPNDKIEHLLRSSSAVGFAHVLTRYGNPGVAPAVGGEVLPLPASRSSQRRARAAEDAPPTLIVVVDQFEELFRFAALGRAEVERKEFLAARGGVPVVDGTRNEAQEFIDLLLEASRQTQQPVFVVLTMRSDFLHRCETFDQLPGLISANQFLCPQLQREQIDDAITVPAARFGGAVTEELTNRILNDLSPETDRLPVLEHALARMWKLAADGSPSPTLTLAHYDAVGGLSEAINLHGKEMLAVLCGPSAEDEAAAAADLPAMPVAKVSGAPPTASRLDVERFFRCLAEWDQAGALVRRPCRVDQIAAETGLSLKTVRAIADVFRATGNHWLRPLPEDVEVLAEGDVVDLIHESLLRKWTWLAKAMGREREWRDAFQRLGESMVDAHWCTAEAVGRDLHADASPGQPDKQVSRHPGWWVLLLGSSLTRVQIVRYSKTLRKPYEPTEAAAARYHHAWRSTERFLWFAKRRDDLMAIWPAIAFFLGVVALAATVAILRVKEAEAKVVAERLKSEGLAAEQGKVLGEEARLRQAQDYAKQQALSQQQLEDVLKKLTIYEQKDTQVAALSRESAQLALAVNQFNGVFDSLLKQTQRPSAPQTLFNAVSFMAAPATVPALEFLLAGDRLQIVSGRPGGHVNLWTLAGALQREVVGTSADAFFRVDASSVLAVGGQVSLLLGTPQGVESRSLGSAAALLAPGESIVCAQSISRGRTLFATDKGSLGWLGAPPVAVHSRSRAVINAVQYLPGKEWVLASGDDGSANLWDVRGPEPVLVDAWKANAPVRNAAFDASGTFALIPSGEKRIPLVRLASVETGKPLSGGTVYWLPHKSAVIAGRFAPTATVPLVATVDTSGQIFLWSANPDAADQPVQNPRAILSGHSRQQDAANRLKLAWAADGSFLVSGDEKGLLLVWRKPMERSNTAFGDLPLVLPGPQGAVTALTVSPDSRFIANAGADGTVRVVPLHPTLTGPALVRFGGKDDTREPPSAGLALFDEEDAAKESYRYLFLPQNEKTPLGLTRRLKPEEFYLAARWDYTLTSRTFLRTHKVRVRNPNAPDQVAWAQAVDWGPPAAKGAADLSPGLAQKLGLKESDPVEISVDVLGADDNTAR